MRVRILAVLLASAALPGCAPYAPPIFATYPAPGPLHYAHCGRDGHTEAYPLAHDERHAYGCKSDTAGYLEGAAQADRKRY